MHASLVLAADGSAAALPERAARPRPSLAQCLLLALLLHLWLLALVGTAPGTGLSPGAGSWSSWSALRIRLDGPGPDDSPGLSAQPQPQTGPVGRAPEPRFGGAVRDAVPRPSPEPGAAQLGHWGPQPTPDALRPPSSATPAVAEPAPKPATAPALLRSERPSATALPAEASALPSQPATPDPPLSRPLDEGAGSSTAPRPAPDETRQAPVLQQTEPSLRDITNSARTPAAVPQPRTAPQRSEPAVGTQVTEPVRPALAPVADPEPPVADLPRPQPAPPPVAATPASWPSPVPVVEPPSPPEPAVTPKAAAAVLPPPAAAPERPAADAAQPLPAPAAIARTPPVPSTLPPVEAMDLPPAVLADLQAPPVRSAETRPQTAPAPAPVAPGDSLSRAAGVPTLPPAGGAPAAGARVGPDRATAPSAAASAPLKLDLPSARAPLPGLANPRLLNLAPPPPLRKSPLAEGIEKAAKPDCRKAYAGMGLLGIVPLAADAMRDGGCRW